MEGGGRRLHPPATAPLRLQTDGRLTVRVMFIAYLVLIWGGLAAMLAAGLMHR